MLILELTNNDTYTCVGLAAEVRMTLAPIRESRIRSIRITSAPVPSSQHTYIQSISVISEYQFLISFFFLCFTSKYKMIPIWVECRLLFFRVNFYFFYF